jgi:Bifunctional DNA primase/polymerase, N-terminal
VSSTPTDDLTVSPPVPEVSDLARTSDTLDTALAYVARGYSVIPLVPGTKRPAVKLAPFLDESQRMTDADVRAYWSQNPQAGIAIVTGAPSGLVVVDVDPRNGGSVEAVLE